MPQSNDRDQREKDEIARQIKEQDRVRRELSTDRLLDREGLDRDAVDALRRERLAAKIEREELERQLRRGP